MPALLQIIFCLSIALHFLCCDASADGKVFARAATTVITADQRAMLYYSNGVERLVIETSFSAEGTNFAWVIPFPSAPKVEAVSTNFFPTLNLVYQPELIHRASNLWVFWLVMAFCVSVLIWIYRKPTRTAWYEVLAFLALCFLMVLIALPNFVRSRGSTSVTASPPVEVLNQERVGVFDTVTLKGANGLAVLDWLNANRFHTPAAALNVINEYAKQGWVFVASTLHREPSSPVNSRPHPLAFTFASSNAIYPLRLTGVENTSCTIELLVFGPDRAEVPGFKVEYCGRPQSTYVPPEDGVLYAKEWFAPPMPGSFSIGNTELLRYAMPARVTTKLVGSLTPMQMSKDALVGWAPFEPLVPVVHSRRAAAGLVLNWIVGILAPGLLLIQIVSPRYGREQLRRTLLVLTLIAALAGFCRSITLRRTDVTYKSGGWHGVANEFKQLDGAIQQFWYERKRSGDLTEQELLQNLNRYLKYGAKNVFSDAAPIRCEPTPGNLTLRSATNGVDVFWHDYQGAPHWIANFPSK